VAYAYVASCWIYEITGILLGAHLILHISRIRVNFIKFWFFYLSSKTLRYPSPLSIHAWTGLVMEGYILAKITDGCEGFDRHKNFVVEVPLHFQLEPNKLGCISVPTDKILW
jgi:hypothetical protein